MFENNKSIHMIGLGLEGSEFEKKLREHPIFQELKEEGRARCVLVENKGPESMLKSEGDWVDLAFSIYQTISESTHMPFFVFVVDDTDKELEGRLHTWISHLNSSLKRDISIEFRICAGPLKDIEKTILSRHFMVAICGPSGAGKSTIVDRCFVGMFEDSFEKLISCTTREPRDGEVDGVDYHFLTKEEFIEQKDQMSQMAVYGGNHYGTRYKDILKIVGNQKTPVCVLSREGVDDFKELMQVRSYLISAHIDLCEQRMRERGDSEDSIKKRLSTWTDEVRYCHDITHHYAAPADVGVEEMVEDFKRFFLKTAR